MELAVHFERGGPLMWPLLVLSILSSGLVLERLWFFRGEIVSAALGWRRSGDRLAVSDPARSSWAQYRRSSDVVARVLATWSVSGPVAAKVEGEEALARAAQGLGALETLTQLSTNLGLLGTVVGVLGVFPHYLAGDRLGVVANLSVALYTTVGGLVIFLYGYFFLRLFQGLLERLARRLEMATTLADAGAAVRP